MSSLALVDAVFDANANKYSHGDLSVKVMSLESFVLYGILKTLICAILPGFH